MWSDDNEPLYTELTLHSSHAVSERHQLAWAKQLMSGNPDELSAVAFRGDGVIPMFELGRVSDLLGSEFDFEN